MDLEKQQQKQNTGCSRKMPMYQSHKVVWALKIKSIRHDISDAQLEDRETDGSAVITPEEPGYDPFRVSHEYVKKHQPLPGGYYVVYRDGYESWSPAQAFEEGYTPLHLPPVTQAPGKLS